VERADNPTLEDAPKAFNRLSVDRADNVLALGMVNGGMRESLLEVSVAGPLVGAQQANLFRTASLTKNSTVTAPTFWMTRATTCDEAIQNLAAVAVWIASLRSQ